FIILVIVTIKIEFDSINNAQKTEEKKYELIDEIQDIMTNIDTVITSNTNKREIKNIKQKKNEIKDVVSSSEIKFVNNTINLQMYNIIAMLAINYLSYDLYAN